MAEARKIGDILDGLDVELDMDDGDLVASALVLAKVIQADGTVTLGMAQSDGCSWIEQAGLLAAAQQVVNQAPVISDDD